MFIGDTGKERVLLSSATKAIMACKKQYFGILSGYPVAGQRQSSTHNVESEADHPFKLPISAMDYAEMRQVCTNLICNAFPHAETG
jgi:hypothetical protein